ncbi:hypothetical protein QA639_21330 [Bradyrhizobium pachyrhizi]|uniref:hypothetical protein n=1 Tax=Bradyrhizobium pachyrhizi TaxID=280333 RepID=UPI0024B1658C|nr:hypothetical protein [Bradyrhizobium pachyrhizi]WFU52253.1 hypothetical protein QA639_21330 [Bradyrhizobium pachyrhizi]
MSKFEKDDWVRSVRVGSKGSFVGQIKDVLDGGEYVVRDDDRKRWLRKEDELSPAQPKADNDNEQADQRARMQHWRL